MLVHTIPLNLKSSFTCVRTAGEVDRVADSLVVCALGVLAGRVRLPSPLLLASHST